MSFQSTTFEEFVSTIGRSDERSFPDIRAALIAAVNEELAVEGSDAELGRLVRTMPPGSELIHYSDGTAVYREWAKADFRGQMACGRVEGNSPGEALRAGLGKKGGERGETI